VTAPVCDAGDSCAEACVAKTTESKITEILRLRAAHDKRAAKFVLAIENIFFSKIYESKPRSVSESPQRASTETCRRVMWTVETEKETSRCFAAPLSNGSDQEGRVEGVKLGR
jgi:hypothetical protein